MRYALYAAVLSIGAATLPPPAYANASVFVNTGVTACGPYGFCTAASMFGLLVGSGDSLSITGTSTTLYNDVAFGTGAKLTTTGTLNIGSSTNSSIIDFADSLTGTPTVPCTGSACKAPNGSSLSTGTKVWGGAASDNGSSSGTVATATNQFTQLASYWNTHTGYTPTSISSTLPTSWNIGTTAGVHLYSATSLTSGSGDLVIGCGTGLASACDPTDLIVVLVSGTVNITRGISFAAASGLSDDQLVFLINATGSGSGSGAALQIGPGANNTARTVHGDFFLPNGNFTLGSTNNGSTVDFYGRIFSNGTLVAASADTVNRGVTVEDEAAVPEPSTWAAMIGGLGVLVYLRRRRQARSSAVE